MGEATSKLVEFRICYVLRIILAFDGNFDCAHLLRLKSHVKKSVSRCVCIRKVDALSALIHFTLFYGPDKFRKKEEGQCTDAVAVIFTGMGISHTYTA